MELFGLCEQNPADVPVELKTKACELLPGTWWGWRGCAEWKSARSEQEKELAFARPSKHSPKTSGHPPSPSQRSSNRATVLKTYLCKMCAGYHDCVLCVFLQCKHMLSSICRLIEAVSFPVQPANQPAFLYSPALEGKREQDSHTLLTKKKKKPWIPYTHMQTLRWTMT